MKYDLTTRAWSQIALDLASEPTGEIEIPFAAGGEAAIVLDYRFDFAGHDYALGASVLSLRDEKWLSNMGLKKHVLPMPTHVAWTGSMAILFGSGTDRGDLPNLVFYEPAADRWTTVLNAAPPLETTEVFSAWTGMELIVISGERAFTLFP